MSDHTDLTDGEGEGFGALGPLLFGDHTDLPTDLFTDEFGDDVGEGVGDEFDELGIDAEVAAAMAPPVHWPRLDPAAACEQMIALWGWVQAFQRRFPEMVRLPQCWPHHNSMVELLQALADYERAAFSPQSAPTSAVSWHLMVRDIEARLREFINTRSCLDAPAGESHQTPGPLPVWREDADLRDWLEASRAAARTTPSPTPSPAPTNTPTNTRTRRTGHE